ncbi:Nitrogen permease regulator 2 [Coemansia sp. RSA 552]|nr:Nitrogen permease regulator 2 [Coemansia sp. RSA 552]
MSFLHNGFPEIRAIFLAQFHPDLGPIVRLSIPDDAIDTEQKMYGDFYRTATDEESGSGDALMISMSKAVPEVPQMVQLIKRPEQPTLPAADSSKIDFNSIQTLVIPKLTLFERLITVNTGKHKVMCYPIAVEGDYARNVFIFNMCFAFDIGADTKCYGPIVKRVGSLLKELETTGKLLSDPEGTRPLRTMMRQLVNKLNDHGEYQIELDLKGLSQPMASTGISIKLFPYYENPQNIVSHHVPVKIVDFELAKRKSAQTVYQSHAPGDIQWDLVLDRVTQFIDNINHVRRIARLTQIHEDMVVLALKHLDYYGCIALADIFQFSNVYEARYQVMDVFRNAWLQRECHSYVTRDGQTSSISIEKLIQMYATVRQRKTVAEWVVENDINVEAFDVRRFFMFGVIHQMLRRVHCYPVLRTPGADGPQASSGSAGNGSSGADPRLLAMLDGTHSMDELSVVEDKDAAALREMFGQHGGVDYVFL